MLHVIDAKYIGDYRISVEFNDGCRFVADFESVIKSDHRPIVQQLADKYRKLKKNHKILYWILNNV